MKKTLLVAALLLTPALAAAQATIAPASGSAVAGSMVSVKMNGWQWPTYAPATRYVRSGNTFIIDFEYASDFFGPSRPDFWDIPVPLGELAPGTYNLQARLHDTAKPGSAPQVVTSPLTVGTNAMHIQSVPSSPNASQNFDMYVPSQYYFDPASVKLSYEGNIVRVDYRFDPSKPVTPMLEGMSGPAGLVSWTRVNVAGLPPGDYWMYSVGSPNDGSNHFFITYEPLQVRTSVDAVEYYAESTDRYFITANGPEISYLDSTNAGWKRTGQQFQVWTQSAGAPAGVAPVCHFYLQSEGAHYHTAIPAECQWLRDLESQDRAKAAKGGEAFQGWTYQGVAFHALLPGADGQCADGTKPVFRGYDGPFRRYASDSMIYGSMAFTYTQEGAVFCTPR